MLPPPREHSFHFFTFAPPNLQNGTQKLLKWWPGGSFGSKMKAREVFTKRAQTNHQQWIKYVNKTVKTWVAQKWSFWCLSGSAPKGGPGRSQGPFQAPSKVQILSKNVPKWMPQTWFLWCFNGSCLHSITQTRGENLRWKTPRRAQRELLGELPSDLTKWSQPRELNQVSALQRSLKQLFGVSRWCHICLMSSHTNMAYIGHL